MNKFLDELQEQPAALKETLKFYDGETGKNSLKRIVDLYKIGDYTEVILTGMGSSFFSSYLASCLLSEYGIRAYALNTSELLHYQFSLISRKTLLVCVSQSGESYEIVKILQELPEDVTRLAVTNEEASTLAQEGSEVLLAKAGHEEMTSSKSFVSISLVKLIFCWAMAGKWDNTRRESVLQLIDRISELIGSYTKWMEKISDFFGEYNNIEIIGRGPSYSSVQQGALMFREAVRNPATGHLGGEFRHGPMEMVREGCRAVIMAAEGKTLDQSIKMAYDIARFKGKVIVITNSELSITEPNIHVFRIDVKDEYLFAIGSIIPLQFMVNSRAIELGRKPGYFTRGAKVTIEE